MGDFEQEEKAEQGNEFYDKEEFDEALSVWKEGLALIPEPKKFYSESVWFIVSIGDIHFMRENFSDAFECFDSARQSLGS